MFGFDDILIGAGIGALGSALFGQNPIKGAALGGVTGGLLGGLPAGAWGGGQAAALSTTPASMGISLAPAAVSDASLALAPEIVSTAPTAYGIDLAASPVGTGITDLGAYATGTGTNIMARTPSLLDKISPYANVQNLSGAANIYEKFNQPTRMPSPQGGNVSRGQAPEGNGVMDLIKAIRQPERRHISLL